MGPGGVGLDAYRAAVGVWSAAVGGGRMRVSLTTRSSPPNLRCPALSVLYLFLLLRASALLRHGDIKPNRGPSSSTSPTSSIFLSPPPLPSASLTAANSQTGGGVSRPEVASPAVSPSNVTIERRACGDVRTPTEGKHTCARPTVSPPAKLLRELQVAVLNARSIANKLPEFQRTMLDIRPCAPDVVAVTETWLNDQIPDNVIIFPGYSALFRTDRSNKSVVTVEEESSSSLEMGCNVCSAPICNCGARAFGLSSFPQAVDPSSWGASTARHHQIRPTSTTLPTAWNSQWTRST